MLRLTIIILFFLFLLNSCDSAQKDSNTLEEVLILHEKSLKNSTDSSFAYLKLAEKYLKETPSIFPDSLRAKNNYLLGLQFKEKGKLDSAFVRFHLATDFVGDSIIRESQADYYNEAWWISMNLEKYGDGLVILERYRAALGNKNYRKLWLKSFYNDVWTYKQMRNYNKALEIIKFQEPLTREIDPINTPNLLISRADIKYRYLKEKKEAFAILDSLIANDNLLTFNDKRQAYGAYGVFSYYEGNFKNALKNYKASVSNTKKMQGFPEQLDLLANGYNNIAEVLIDLKQYENARKYLDSVKLLGLHKLEERQRRYLLNYELRLANETNKELTEVMAIMDTLYYSQNKIYEEKFNSEILELSKANENKKKLLLEKQATEVKNVKLKSRVLLLIVVLVLLGPIGYLFFRQRRLRFEKVELQMQQRLLRSQMNPHFTFNTLYAIQNKIDENPKEGSKYLLKFSRLLRLILENSTQNYVLLEKELETLKKYLDLQLLRFPSKFTYSITLDNMYEDELIFIPPMLIQPFIENSIEHGFTGIDYLGKLTLNLSMKEKFIHCSIEDNGKGFTDKNDSKKRSMSMKLISDFLFKATKSEIKIIDKQKLSKKETGIKISFLIPHKKTEND
jgi:hypothetical protein